MKVPVDVITIFVAIAESGSFSSASKVIGKSQASLSIAIQSLEIELGFNLFNRSPSGVALTDDGYHYYQECQRLLADCERFNHAISGISAAPLREIKIGVDSLFASGELEKALINTLERYQEVNISVTSASSKVLSEQFHQQQLDMAFGWYPCPDTLSYRRLYDVQWTWVVSAHSVRNGSKPSIRGKSLLIPMEAEVLGLRDKGVLSRARVIGSIELLLELCRAGKGAAYLPYHHVRALLARGELVTVRQACGQDVWRTTLLLSPKLNQHPEFAWINEQLTNLPSHLLAEPLYAVT